MVMSFFRKPEEGGLSQIDAQVQRMINDARHTFDLAMNALTGGPVATIADEVRRTDRQINVTEMEIRRELVVHASVHGGVDTPEVLVFMNMIKDLERIGDYNKNIFDLADDGVSMAEAPDLDQVLGYRDEISSRIALMGELLTTRDEDRARAYIARGDEMRRDFDARIIELLHSTETAMVAVPRALLYRFLKRVTAHSLNVVSAIVMPVDRLGYFDEDTRT
ncbi:MAG: PhoU domain-containing protein [Acidimicrobiales bacterium]|jgi:phosphate uptake regulator|nr:PhoU domain-containing protein [Actinomycetes bacterium]MDP6177118.1 PhoU domain-containing protein [Acidimicrobiales bacterium]MCP4846080.1 PhoU domain-containing protein [Actinomycetes bacterium]MDP6239792.1 PhoU domain-containing protein [Acidimicrobiales bacterium]MDP7124911.1 PhoU domain-containing protein [Acidimicrobiales bacterium]|tara:strand:- start:17755 stop:18417 length:663 start_codon:yes stop_codon:yes gene_type:complete